MRDIEPPFTIQANGISMNVVEAEVNEDRLFHVSFSDRRKTLIITVAEDRKDVKFWTSIPEGRQTEAEQIGRLIATFIRSKKKLADNQKAD